MKKKGFALREAFFSFASMALTLKQEKFVNRYLECGNASEAYRYAYDCSRMSDVVVYNKASLMLSKGEIRVRLEYLRAHLAEASGISALRIIREHEKIAFSDATRVRDGWMSLKDFESLTPEERACIKSVETKTRKMVGENGETIIDEQVKIATYDKQKSLDSITAMLGYNAPQKIEGEIDTGMPLSIEIIDSRDKVQDEDSDD